MKTHIMLDLETWGETPGSDIRSIGAVVFDPLAPYGGFIGMKCPSCKNGATDPWGCTDCLNTGTDARGEFYIACDNPQLVDPTGNDAYVMRYPLTREPETVQWWGEQSPEAQAAFENPVDLRDALYSFGYWLGQINAGEATDMSDSPLRIWANDPQFDVSILEAAYRAVGLPHPWHYRAPRSFRTIVELSGMSRDDMQQFNTGTTHNALDDAISQAKIVCEAYKRLGLNNPPRQEYSIAWNERKTVGVIVKEDEEHQGLTYELRKGALNSLGVVTGDFVEAWAEMTADDNCTLQKGVVL